MLDLEWFKREVRYSMTPLGVANDRVRQVGGRYDDNTDFDFMMRMGVWTENLSLPAVINECLLQSWSGVIRLFPNTTGLGRTRFRDLRAAGAHLVSASWDGKQVGPVTVQSEKGAAVRIANPWAPRKLVVRSQPGGKVAALQMRDDVAEFPTRAGETYSLSPA